MALSIMAASLAGAIAILFVILGAWHYLVVRFGLAPEWYEGRLFGPGVCMGFVFSTSIVESAFIGRLARQRWLFGPAVLFGAHLAGVALWLSPSPSFGTAPIVLAGALAGATVGAGLVRPLALGGVDSSETGSGTEN